MLKDKTHVGYNILFFWLVVLKQTLAQTPFNNKLCRNNNKLCCYKVIIKYIILKLHSLQKVFRAPTWHTYSPFFPRCII